MYGIAVKDTPLTSFISNEATPLLYWGKKEISHTQSVNNYNNTLYTVFNFPSSWSVAFFIYSKTLDTGVYASPVIDGGFWKISVNWINDAGVLDFTVYAFVEPKRIVTPSWGMKILNPAGEVVYHTGRPALSIKDVGNYTGTYKPASTGDGYYFKGIIRPRPSGIFNIVRFKGAYKKSDGTYAVGYETTRSSSSRGIYDRDIVSSVPIIDAGYYDQFTSIGS